MTALTFTVVLLAALLHAGWNVLVKSHPDRLLSLAALQAFTGLTGLGMLVVFGLPQASALPFALLSGVLHTVYNLFLVRAYRHADLSQVYPIARGAAPLLTLLGTSLLLRDPVSPALFAAILVLVLGLLMAGASRTVGRADPHAVPYALGTAALIAIYSLVDGQGARQSGNAFGYAGLIFVLDATFLLVTSRFIRGAGFTALLVPQWRQAAMGAAASCAAYALVLWAMTVAPIASVAALRETSIVFVLLLSARVLREVLTWQRIAGGVLIVLGAVLIRLG